MLIASGPCCRGADRVLRQELQCDICGGYFGAVHAGGGGGRMRDSGPHDVQRHGVQPQWLKCTCAWQRQQGGVGGGLHHWGHSGPGCTGVCHADQSPENCLVFYVWPPKIRPNNSEFRYVYAT